MQHFTYSDIHLQVKMEDYPLYVPHYENWKHYFKKLSTSHQQYHNGKLSAKVIPSHTVKRKEEGPSVELQMTSETQSTVEKADAKERRRKSLKRAAGEQIIISKKIRQTDNTTPSKTANVLKCTPVAGNDIFS